MFWKFDLFTLPPTHHVTIYFYVRRKDFIGFEYLRVFFSFVLQEGGGAGSVISTLSDFSAIKELDKITKEIEDLGRLV